MIALFVLLIGFRSLIPFTVFFSVQEKIVEEYCINKERPEMQCNGKCYLSKQLNETEQHADSLLVKNIRFTENYLHFEYLEIPFINDFIVTIKHRYFWQSFYSINWVFEYLKPPIV
ncbi:hypothetical protein NZD85_13010 [Empedobacter stercoris]|mgnify:CR=1 FL=1|uniref:Uncharacterized protein n=1 Tax=Empedobacter falsenii TaxID=343874 RepID=A0ABY8V9L5_9FLAO|nr:MULTISPECIES: hypothetical protein [Empedobacter]UWX66777.1 hypothetical protein NZD85_13010 [Empedobacter stercoris]WIH96954.1 hypothetical protein OBA43_11960 [Empedobacter falsenii]